MNTELPYHVVQFILIHYIQQNVRSNFFIHGNNDGFPRAIVELRQKWQIATENEFSHIICMPGVSKALIREFIEELKREKNRIEFTDREPAPF